MAISDLMGMFWGNIGGAINWHARANDNINFNSSLSMTHFNPKMEMDIMDNNQVMWTYIHTYSLTERISHYLSENHSLEYGLRSELLRVKSAEWVINSTKEREIRSLWENSVWAEYTGSFGQILNLSAGTRITTASVLSAPRFHSFNSVINSDNQFKGKTYLNIEPRLNFKFNITPFQNIKVCFGVSSQNLHAIRSSSTSFPFDRYALTSADVKPEKSFQYGVGYAGMNSNGEFDWSVEGYYRDINNVYDFKDGKTTFSDIVLESLILGGRGRSYGAEFMIRKNTGRLTGWISYTISKTETKIPGINSGLWYNASNDRRNDLAIAAIYRLTDRWNISGSWIFMSGQPLTAPDVKYTISGETCYYYSERNSYLTPPIHRLDLSAQYIHTGKKITYEWAFGIYNTYCRYNPYIVYFQDDPSKPSGTRAVLRAMYGLIPSLSYTLRF